MKLILVEAPIPRFLQIAEDLSPAAPRKIMTVSKEVFDGKMDLDRHPVIVSSLRMWQGLMAPAEGNWEVVRDALELVPDAEVLAEEFEYQLEDLLNA